MVRRGIMPRLYEISTFVRNRSYQPCGILVSGVCLAVVNFHLANFYPKIRSTIVASINGSCQAGVIQSGIHKS